MLLLLIVLLVLMLGGFGAGWYPGPVGPPPSYPYRGYGWGGGFILLIVLLVLIFGGYLR